MKSLDMEKTSELMPEWMEIKHKNNKSKEIFKKVEYNNPLRQKAKCLISLVDKNLNPSKLKPMEYNPSRSIFNFHDFSHNITFYKEREKFDSTVSKLPRKFFDWDDGKKFNPKYKNDV